MSACHFSFFATSVVLVAADEHNTGNLNAEEVRSRNIIFYSLFGVTVSTLPPLGIWLTYKKTRQLRLGPLSLTSHRGLCWNGKPLCQCCSQLPSEEHLSERYSFEGQPADEGAALLDAGDEDLVDRIADLQAKAIANHPRAFTLRLCLLTLSFISYVGVSVGAPALFWSKVSCNNGFFWEDHLLFLGVFWVTKVLELMLYGCDPTIQGELSLLEFLMKFSLSFLGYADGYTDAVSIAIAWHCRDEVAIAGCLAWGMAVSYCVGVIFMQWVVVIFLVFKDPTHACFMKLMHMDALAACITLPDHSKWIWNTISIVRTFAEDIPQAVLQTLFIAYVTKKPFMVLSVFVSVCASFKAIYDAARRKALAAGASLLNDPVYKEQLADFVQAMEAHGVPEGVWLRLEGFDCWGEDVPVDGHIGPVIPDEEAKEKALVMIKCDGFKGNRKDRRQFFKKDMSKLNSNGPEALDYLYIKTGVYRRKKAELDRFA